MNEILVPAAPGILCAQGLIVSDLKEDFVASERIAGDEAGLRRLAGHAETLSDRARAWFDAEGVPADHRRLELGVDARYVGQNFELAVFLTNGDAGGDAGADRIAIPEAEHLRARFLEVHESAYGYANPDDPIEIVNVRLTARGRLREDPAPLEPGDPGPLPEPFEHQGVRFTSADSTACPVYDRESLRAGHALTGPAILEQLDSTTPIFPGDTAVVDRAGNLIIQVANGAAHEA